MLYTIMGTDPDSMACNGSFLKCTSHMCIQFQQPLFIDQNAIAGIPGTEKIEMKLDMHSRNFISNWTSFTAIL